MKTADIIQTAYNTLDTYVSFMRKDIKFSRIDPDSGNMVPVEAHKFKSVIEGRKQSFEDALNTITLIRQHEEANSVKSDEVEKNYRNNLKRLVDSTDNMLMQVKKVAEKEIDVDESEDERVKLISMSKSMSLDFLFTVKAIRDDYKSQLTGTKKLTGSSRRNFLEEKIKGKKN